jgi:hypothetical protein
VLGPFLWQGLGVNESMGTVSGKAELCALFGCGKSRKMSDAAPIGTPIGAGQPHQLSRLAAQLARQSCAGLRQSPCGRVPSIDHDDACRSFFAPSPPPATGVCLGVDGPDKPRRQLPASAAFLTLRQAAQGGWTATHLTRRGQWPAARRRGFDAC